MNYWKGRENLNYYRRVQELVEQCTPVTSEKTLLDVGGGVLQGARYLERFPDWNRTSVEKWGGEYSLPGFRVEQSDFLEWEPPEQQFDMVLCLQVLEHLTDAEIPLFVEKLLACGKTLIVSVPHEWPRGKVPGHLQDPIDETKLRGWFPREPKLIEVCCERGSHPARLIAMF